jgi:Cu(I)/Ag(I) efflux system protein CusF
MNKPTLALLALATSLAACGNDEPAGGPAAPASQSSAQAESTGVGVVESIDAANGRITIAHEAIEALGWPAMTMGFKVARPELLEGIESGERIDFTLRGRDMDAVVTSIKPRE